HRVLHFTHAAFLHHEAHRELEPVVGDAPEDARLEILDMHEILGLEVTSRLAGELREGAGVAPRDIEQDALGGVAVVTIRDGHADLLPDEWKIARVVVDRLVENAAVRHRYDAAGELAALDPHGRVGGLHRGRLAHFHDLGLHEPERDHVAAHAAHDDPITDGEVVAAQDHDVAGDGR